MMSYFLFFFFFFSSRRRHTRSYGDWSSDVCSSDLFKVKTRRPLGAPVPACGERARRQRGWHWLRGRRKRLRCRKRSEERRVGKECRCRWWAEHEKKKKNKKERGGGVESEKHGVKTG